MNLLINAIKILTVLFLFIGCAKQDEIPTPDSINYLALGDSYTIGQGVEEAERWPNQLRQKL